MVPQGHLFNFQAEGVIFLWSQPAPSLPQQGIDLKPPWNHGDHSLLLWVQFSTSRTLSSEDNRKAADHCLTFAEQNNKFRTKAPREKQINVYKWFMSILIKPRFVSTLPTPHIKHTLDRERISFPKWVLSLHSFCLFFFLLKTKGTSIWGWTASTEYPGSICLLFPMKFAFQRSGIPHLAQFGTHPVTASHYRGIDGNLDGTR